ncbi:Methylated-DNA--protein-cysteine methyltransferase, partial [Stegodyphus mimosarum]
MRCSISKTVLACELGKLDIFCCSQGVHRICISQENGNKLDTESKKSMLESGVFPTMSSVALWFTSYFTSASDSSKMPLPPICPEVFSKEGKFTEKVWKTLMMNVPVGETVSYAYLAALSGNNRASRAVGTAMKKNPIQIIIPCHRVLKSDGSLGEYSGGKNIKEWLINHENKCVVMNT